MQVNIYGVGNIPNKRNPVASVLRTEHVFETNHGTHMVLVLDAEDSIDVIIETPDGQRREVWSLVKGEEEAA